MQNVGQLFSDRVRGEWGVIANGYEISFLDNDNVLKLDYGDGSTIM